MLRTPWNLSIIANGIFVLGVTENSPQDLDGKPGVAICVLDALVRPISAQVACVFGTVAVGNVLDMDAYCGLADFIVVPKEPEFCYQPSPTIYS